MRRLVLTCIAALALGACAEAPPPPRPVAAAPAPQVTYLRVPLTARGGTPHVQVAIAGICCASFTVDSGAADVTVSAEIFVAMVKEGYVTKADLIDVVNYRTANGVIEGLRFRMPPMTVGGHTVHNVVGSVSKGSTSMLLGQSFLRKFRFWAIDNNAGVLVLG